MAGSGGRAGHGSPLTLSELGSSKIKDSRNRRRADAENFSNERSRIVVRIHQLFDPNCQLALVRAGIECSLQLRSKGRAGL